MRPTGLGSRRARRALVAGGVTLLSAASAVAAVHGSTGSYSGANSENGSVSFKITGGGATISNFHTTLGYNGKCGAGGGPVYNADASSIAIQTGGQFSKKIMLRFSATVHAPGRISGTVSGTGVSGKVVQYLNGKPNRCYTETFTAHKV